MTQTPAPPRIDDIIETLVKAHRDLTTLGGFYLKDAADSTRPKRAHDLAVEAMHAIGDVTNDVGIARRAAVRLATELSLIDNGVQEEVE